MYIQRTEPSVSADPLAWLQRVWQLGLGVGSGQPAGGRGKTEKLGPLLDCDVLFIFLLFFSIPLGVCSSARWPARGMADRLDTADGGRDTGSITWHFV
jgi:hypothetical protein